jgi:hypothetical protein
MRYGGLQIVRAAFRGISALPPPGDWRAVLGVGTEADLETAEAAWRDKARTAHPDRRGGSGELMAELNAARAAAKRDFS